MPSIRVQIGTSLAAFALLTAAAGCDSAERADKAVRRDSIKSRSPDREMERAFRLFRTEGTTISPEMVERLRAARAPVAGAYLRAHTALTPNGRLWALVAGRSVCIFAARPLAIGCTPRNMALRRGVTLGIVENPGARPGPGSKRRFVLYGVVPGPRRTVMVQSGKANTLVVPVHKGTFSARSREPLFLRNR